MLMSRRFRQSSSFCGSEPSPVGTGPARGFLVLILVPVPSHHFCQIVASVDECLLPLASPPFYFCSLFLSQGGLRSPDPFAHQKKEKKPQRFVFGSALDSICPLCALQRPPFVLGKMTRDAGVRGQGVRRLPPPASRLIVVAEMAHKEGWRTFPSPTPLGCPISNEAPPHLTAGEGKGGLVKERPPPRRLIHLFSVPPPAAPLAP